MKFQLLLALGTLCLAGCASSPVTAEWVSSQTATSHDPFQKVSWTAGPFIPYGNQGLYADPTDYTGNLYLCKADFDSGSSEYFLEVENTTNAPELFTSAASMAGDNLTLEEGGEQVPPHPMGPNDRYKQKVRILVSKDLLAASATTGLTVRLYGQQRVLDVRIPAQYIRGFLRKA